MSDIILITGATGYIGSNLVKFYNEQDSYIIYAQGRNPARLNELKLKYPKIRTVLGCLSRAIYLPPADVVVHAAAQKHVSLAEENPIDTIESNIMGTMHVLAHAITVRAKRFVFISTDKSANAGNVYGMTKYLGERVVLSLDRPESVVCRFGNVFGSTGSVIPLWFAAVKNKQPIKLTNPDMTRFMFCVEDAVKIIDYAIEVAVDKEIIIPKMRSVRMGDLLEAFTEYVNMNLKLPVLVNVTGATPGEKIHESLNCPNEKYGYENEHIYTLCDDYVDSPLDLNVSSETTERVTKDELLQWIHNVKPNFFAD
jgi:UDP-N-acetylglucosamine 4,6-dehydratase